MMSDDEDILAGLTHSDCPAACRPDHCVISGRAVCGHPKKGSHVHVSGSRDAIVRLERAKEILGHQVRRN